MTPDGTYTAVLDRIEDGLAALELTTEDGRHELLVPLEELPPAGRQADAVLEIEVENGEVVEATYDAEATEAGKDDAQSRFDRLSQRPPDGDAEGSDRRG